MTLCIENLLKDKEEAFNARLILETYDEFPIDARFIKIKNTHDRDLSPA